MKENQSGGSGRGIDSIPEGTRKFVAGGMASGCATLLTNPFDVLKVRMQLRPKPMWSTFVHIFKNENVFSLWGGLTPSLLRSATFSSTRLYAFRLLYLNL